MNRRKPRIDVAVVPVVAGEDAASAVLRKACGAALAAVSEQGAQAGDRLRPFVAGYLAGHARQHALKHAVDAEREGNGALVTMLDAMAPEALRPALAALRFTRRGTEWGRAGLRAETPLADAGYIVGHLESLCGTRRLLAMAPGMSGDAAAIEAYLTACDGAADRMQTHHPTAALRLTGDERAILLQAFASD